MTAFAFDFTPQAQVPRSDQVGLDTYFCKLVEVSEPRKDKGFKEGDPDVIKQDFTFEIVSGEATDKEWAGKHLVAIVRTDINFGFLDGAKKSTLYKVLKAILGNSPELVGKFTTEQLVGRTVKIDTEMKASADGTKQYVNIGSYSPDRKQAVFGGGPVQQTTPSALEGHKIEDIKPLF